MSDPLPPASMSDLPPVPPPAPAVLTWYRVYAAAMVGTYAVLTVLMMILPAAGSGSRSEMPGWVLPLIGACVALPFLGAYVAAFVLPRRPWAWTYHLVLICFGFTSACCIPVCIPLLIFWLKPETKLYFGRTV